MEKPALIVEGKRVDGRALDQLRPIRMKAHVINAADGSAYVEWGMNKVLAGVYGPKKCLPRHGASPYRAVIKCRYSMAPFSVLEERIRTGPSRRSRELSMVIREVFENVIFLESYPETQIDIFIDILQAGGGTRCAGITAASIALADAGIPMRDLVYAVSAGKIEGNIALDLSKDEDNYGEADVPVAVAPRNRDILLFQMDGLLTKDEIDRILEMSFSSSEVISRMQVEALREAYSKERTEAVLPL